MALAINEAMRVCKYNARLIYVVGRESNVLGIPFCNSELIYIIGTKILQAGLNYKTVVYPRVEKLLLSYSAYKTTCDFLILIQTIPLNKLINWNNKIKINRITDLSWFLYNNSIETESDLGIWLCNIENKQKLLQINGIGNKTVDYLKMLSGKPAIAIDRHLFKYLEYAGVVVKSYEEANKIYLYAAKYLNMTFYELDKKIWTYMSNLNYSYI